MICNQLTREESVRLYIEVLKDGEKGQIRKLCECDLFFLILIGMKRKDINQPWLYDRCREVEANPDGYLDLWSREHYKSTIITFAKTIQDILCNPELTVGIFSHTKPIARGFLSQIKRELEENKFLIDLFPDVLYDNPKKDSPKWSVDEGIIVKRKSNPKECTVEAHGLVDGQPTSKHFSLLIFDDVVTRESVTTPEQIQKVTEAWSLSLNLGANGGTRRYIGTRYHYNDTYRTIMDRGSAIPRIKPAIGEDGKPVFLSQTILDEKRRDMGSYVFACHGVGTKITMSDWSQKNIEDVVVGDKVVGWTMSGDKFEKAKLTITEVLATNNRKTETVKSIMENGEVLVHTPDHKWWSGRVREIEGDRKRKIYSELGGKGLHSLCKVFDMSIFNKITTDEEKVAIGYLSGMIDGEGACSYKTIQISQDFTLHPEICKKIEWCLETLHIKYSIFDKKRNNRKGIGRLYTILGGRNARIRLLNLCREYLAKSGDIEKQCFTTRDFGYKYRTKLVSQINNGIADVYNIQTTTGNYIANGFCSKNCQMLQNPSEDNAMGFNSEWLRYYDKIESLIGWNVYILVDPAGEKKKKNNGDPDYTVIEVVGLSPDGNYYTIDAIRDRLNLTERTAKLFAFVRKYRPIAVAYEKYGIQSDIEHIKYIMEQQNFRFTIIPVGGSMAKNDRIRKLVPIFEQGRWYIPHTLKFLDAEGKVKDYTFMFVNDEFNSFPVGSHDDMLDCKARILSPELRAVFPEITESVYEYKPNKNVSMAQTDYDIFA